MIGDPECENPDTDDWVMTRETKVGLLIGLGVILLIGIIISDSLSIANQQEGADLAGFGPRAQDSVDPDANPRPAAAPAHRVGPAAPPPSEIPTIATPEELDAEPAAPEPIREPPPIMPLQTALAVDHEPAHRPIGFPLGQPAAQAPQDPRDPEPQADPAPLEPPARLTPPPIRTTAGPTYHMVQPGQTLFEIAEEYYGDGELWRHIAANNPGRVRSNGHVNQHVRLLIPQRPDAPAVSAGSPAEPRRTVQTSRVTVNAGDTLSAIARRHLGDASRWDELLDANRDQLDRPEDLRSGMTLRLPSGESFTVPSVRPERAPARAARTYTVRAGESLYAIAERTLGDGERWRDIQAANRDTVPDPDDVQAGQVLKIPSRD